MYVPMSLAKRALPETTTLIERMKARRQYYRMNFLIKLFQCTLRNRPVRDKPEAPVHHYAILSGPATPAYGQSAAASPGGSADNGRRTRGTGQPFMQPGSDMMMMQTLDSTSAPHPNGGGATPMFMPYGMQGMPSFSSMMAMGGPMSSMPGVKPENTGMMMPTMPMAFSGMPFMPQGA